MKQVTIYTDGGCKGNPGPGGWAAVLLSGAHRKEVSGGEAATTNNRMELRAAIGALGALKERCAVEVYTDSQYLRDGIDRWISGWKRNGWRTRDKQAVKNADLWRELDALVGRHQIVWKWVKGHAGNEHNERCDELARLAVTGVKRVHGPVKLRELLVAFRDAQSAKVPQGSAGTTLFNA